MKHYLISTLTAFLLMTAPSKANEGLIMTMDLAEQAIKKGHGEMCSLEYKPVKSGGYYPCLDFGPYRYVREYQKVTGFVIQKGKAPFKIFEGPLNEPNFIYNGPWETDVSSRMVMWWDSNIEGNTRKIANENRKNKNKDDAAKYVTSLNSSPDDDAMREKMAAEKKTTAPTSKQEIMTDDIKSILSQ